MTEIWKDIKDYEGLYQVSNLGRVKSLNYRHTGRERVMEPSKHKVGYLLVSLCKDGKQKTFLIHRLVAEDFIPNPENKPEVNHKSENKQDNRVENLEWVWHKDNCNHGTRNKRVAKAQSKTVIQFSKTGEFIREWESLHEIERQLGYFIQNISKCCLGQTKSAYGYFWKYKERVD